MREGKQSYNLDTMASSQTGQDQGHVNIAFENDPGLDTGKKKLSTASASPSNAASDTPAREQWDNPIEFLLSCIAMSVGLGNIWRFPFTAYQNGGGAFLIPYLVVLIFIGRPIYFLELSLGQFCSFGQVKAWKLAPFFKGVGYGSMIGTICVVSYYASIMALTVFYFFASFAKTLPWSECNDDWVNLGRKHFDNVTNMHYDLSCNETDLSQAYYTDIDGVTNQTTYSIPQLFFENEVLKQKMQIDDGIGAPEWRLTLCLLFSWLLIWGSLIKGVSSSGKVAYFTALFPYVVLAIMLIRGVTLPGAWNGIKVFINPDWEKMLDPNVWYAAVGQCFFSLSTGFGPIIMFSSYNPFRHNVYRDAVIISFMDTFTSLLAGVTIFAVLGNLAEELGVDVLDVAQGGPGLAFVSYPAAIARFDWVPQLFAVLFYLMLFTLGVGSATSLTGGIITIFCDQFPSHKRWKVTTIICGVGFIAGLLYVTPGGQFMLTLVDKFGANFVIYVMATVEVMAIAWVYGLNNFITDIEFMLGIRVGWYWKFCWGFFVPVGLTVILFYSLATEKRLTHDGFEFPDAAIACGWMIAVVALVTLPICAFHAVKTRKSFGWMEKLKESFRPTKDWGPRQNSERRDWIAFKNKQM